jgi:Glycosyl transferases group 1
MAKTRFSRTFVVGAYIPNGGTYMAYHVGRILHFDFGIEAIAVTVGNENGDNGVHNYDLRMQTISIEDLSRTITDEDILIVNPSFSDYLFGWKLRGFKISYVQNFATYTILDRRFDHYVAVSQFVQQFLRVVYDIDAPVIPAFINLDKIPVAGDWKSRPEFLVLPYQKGIQGIWDASYRRLQELAKARKSAAVFVEPIFGGHYMPQSELLSVISKYRYLVLLSAAEGLPLVPLEAMAMGTVVVGYDGFGGRHYMRPGVNCAVAPYADIEQVAELLIEALSSPEKTLAISERARETAMSYSYNAFRHNWMIELSPILGVPQPAIGR